MKKYIGTKQVSATPAWRIDGKVYPKDGAVPRVMNREDGYKVVYEDGYESWSPKDVFEKAYKVADTFLDRLKAELVGLDEKQAKLNAFFDTNIFKGLDEHRKRLMRAQFGAMLAYSQILIERIKIEEENQQ